MHACRSTLEDPTNPDPSAGVAGCRAVAQFWADLSTIDSVTERRARVEHFFYDGIDGFAPVLRPENFAPATGRIRTGANSRTFITRFYQFHLQRQGQRLLVVPGLLENMPYGSLYNAAANLPLGAEFRQFVISQIATLAIRDRNGFFDRIPEKYLLHESHPENQPLAFASEAALNAGMSTAEGQAFRAAIEAELARVGSSISVTNLMTRADLQNCHGCHLGGINVGDGILFPVGFGRTHIDETRDAAGAFTLSPALRMFFAPSRATILSDFLAGKPLPAHSNGNLGGRRTSE